MELSQKPKTLFCYICGRQFGSSSLVIHLKSCNKKFQNEQSKKQPKDQIKIPDPPQQLQQILAGDYDMQFLEAYNQKAINMHKYQILPKCRFCSRTFNQQSLKAHENGCSKKGNQKIQQKSSAYNLPNQFKKPRTLTCCICGRDFGLTSLRIHYPQCLQKFKNGQQNKPKQQRRQVPQFTNEQIDIINTKNDWTLEQIQQFNNKAASHYRDKGMVECPNCSRRFLPQSYLKHKKNCIMINGENKSVSVRKNLPSPQNNFGNTAQQFRKPRTLQCCVCGKQFGLTSLKIHYPQCIEKFQNDQQKKPKSQRKPAPTFSQIQLDLINNKIDWTLQQIQQFNNKANGNYRQKAMVECPNCGRKFVAQSYLKHQKNCVLINGAKNVTPGINNSASQQKFRNTAQQFKKPRTLTCCVCGKQFGLTSLKIHYPQCIQKFQNDQNKKPKAERRQTPRFNEYQLEMINNKVEWTLQDIQEFNNKASSHYRQKGMVQCQNCGRKFLAQSYSKHKKNCVMINGQIKLKNNSSQSKLTPELTNNNQDKQPKKPRVLMCHICGRQFGLKSLVIHQNKCRQKFLNLQNKKPKQERKPLPIFPEQELKNFNLQDAINWSIQKIEEYNKRANQIYRQESLSACPICGRKFFQQSLPKHLKFCQKNKEKLQKQQAQKSTSAGKLSQSVDLKSSSLSKTPTLNRKNSNSIIKKKQQIIQKSIGLQLQQNCKLDSQKKIQCDAEQRQNKKIQQVDQSLQQTFHAKSTTKTNKLKQLMEIHTQLQQNQQLSQGEQKQIQNNQFAMQNQNTAILQNKLDKSEVNQNFNSKNEFISQADCNQIPLSEIQKNSKKYTNQQVVENKNIEDSTKNIQNSTKNIEYKNQQNNIKLKKTPSIDLPSQIQNFKKSQSVNQVLSPKDKIRSSKGFAAPRKKQQIAQANMKQCKICNRKFDPQKIQNHEKICLNNQQRQKKSQKNIKLQQQQAEQINKQENQSKLQQIKQQRKQSMKDRDVLSPQDKIRLRKGFASPRQKQILTQMKMVECRGCKRKFNQQRIQKHESICKQVQQLSNLQPIQQGTYKSKQDDAQNQKLSIKRAPCPKCNRKFAEQRLQKHIQICKANLIQQKGSKNKISNKDIPRSSINGSKQQAGYSIDSAKIQIEKAAAQSMNLTVCQKCGRKFNSQRINKHYQVCKGKGNTQKQFNDTSKDFKKVKNNKEQIPKKQYNLQKVQIQQTDNDLRVQCPKCLRKFLPDRLDKHANACKSVPPLSNIEPVSKALKKQQMNINLQKLKPIQKPKIQNSNRTVNQSVIHQQALKTIGQDQYIQTSLQQCQKCQRKFLPQRIQKHLEICKGNNKFIIKNQKKSTLTSTGFKKINEQQIRKTKNEFFNMVRDIKQKKVKEEDIQKQIDSQLHEIQATHKISRKENVNRQANHSNKKKQKQIGNNKSIILPKI